MAGAHVFAGRFFVSVFRVLHLRRSHTSKEQGMQAQWQLI
jgi:hypothetical protein